MLLFLVLACGATEPTDDKGDDKGDDTGDGAAGGDVGYGPDCAETLEAVAVCDCAAVAVRWEAALADMDAAGAAPGSLTWLVVEGDVAALGQAMCDGSLTQSDAVEAGQLDLAAGGPDAALIDLSGHGGRAFTAVVSDETGAVWAYALATIEAGAESELEIE